MRKFRAAEKAMRCRVEQIVETLREGYGVKKEDEESREYVKFLRETSTY